MIIGRQQLCSGHLVKKFTKVGIILITGIIQLSLRLTAIDSMD